MTLQYSHLSQFPGVFHAMTGLYVPEFQEIVTDLLPRYQAATAKRLERRSRRRAIGAGHPFDLAVRDQILLTIVWLRRYPIYEVLGFLFGVSDSTVTRYIAVILPLLEAAGRDTMRLPEPGRQQRPQLDDLLRDVPGLVIVIDTFEQRVQRPQDRTEADTYYSGKKKQHTLKSQIAVHQATGEIVDVADSVRGPTADLSLLKQSGLLARLPAGVGAMGDLAYVGLSALHPQGLGATPRRKPREQPRPAEDRAYNTAFARQRVVVEHTILRIRRYECTMQADRQHRHQHTARVIAISGLVNRQIRHRTPC
jgi:hypothetical protein